MGDDERVVAAREAFARRDWAAAFDAYSACPDLGGDDLDALAEAAHWLGRPDDAIAGHTAAYERHLADGAPSRAALSAFMLAIWLRLRGDGAQAEGWLARSQRLLADAEEGPEHGYPLYLRVAAMMGQDLEGAADLARHMQALGRRFGDDTLVALGVFFEGRALVKQARVEEGRRLLDEAMLAALTDQLQPMWTGAIYCGLLDACHELADLRRAQEWTEATRRWCEPLPLASLYPGICRVHWAEVLHVRGEWEAAEAEALGAARELVGIDVYAVGDGWYAVGEVRRRRGDLAGADEAYNRAHEAGRDPQPGIALLRLAQGRVDAASGSIAAALAGFGGSRLERAPLLAAQVEVALAAGDLELAAASAGELLEIATTFDSPALLATARCHSAGVALARGQAVSALAELRLAASMWHELDAPYERARCRCLLSSAYRQLGDDDAADREETAARATFERLGAAGDLRLLGGEQPPPCGLTGREVEVLQRLATGTSNREIADSLFISEKTVARHLANIFAKIGVSSRSAATAWAYANDLATAPTGADRR